jgi:hypothetical protein
VAARVAHHYIFDIGALVDLEGIVNFFEVSHLGGIRDEPVSHGPGGLPLGEGHWDLQAIFVDNNVRDLRPVFWGMNVENLPKHVLRQLFPVQLVGKQRLGALSCQPLQLKELRVQGVSIHLDEVVPVPTEERLVLQVLSSEDLNLLLRDLLRPFQLSELVTGRLLLEALLAAPDEAVQEIQGHLP